LFLDIRLAPATATPNLTPTPDSLLPLLRCASSQVRVYDLTSCTLCASLAAHARWINALEVHPSRDDLFVTASEDTTLGVWKCSEPDGRITQVAHVTVTDWLLSGVAFVGGTERTHVAASAYDQAAIQLWRLDAM